MTTPQSEAALLEKYATALHQISGMAQRTDFMDRFYCKTALIAIEKLASDVIACHKFNVEPETVVLSAPPTSEARAALADAIGEEIVTKLLKHEHKPAVHQASAIIQRHLAAAQPTGMEDSREEFEREAKAWGLKLQRHAADCGPFKTGEYVHEKTFDMWLAWQAARQSAAVPEAQPTGMTITEQDIEVAVGGAYEMPDGRKFWNDGPVAREIARRVWERMHQK